MVKIIDGEIVPDDDPRAVEWERRQRQQQGWSDPRLRQSQQQQQQSGTGLGRSAFGLGGMMGGGAAQHPGQRVGSPFQGINNKLMEMGLQPWNVGAYVIEPIFTVAFLLALVFYGIKGLIIVGVVWFLFQRHNAGP
eukprot:gene12299-13567_t